MRVRRVYTWEDPWLTAKWLVIFLIQVKTGFFLSAFWAYLFYSVVSNFYGKHSRTWMRESHERAMNNKERASMLSELIIRHGSDAWVDPLMDELGPWIQLQLGDAADFLEACSSYYEWRNVSATLSTCVIYVALFLLGAATPLDYSVRVFWMAGGIYFFMSRPIGTCYPRFRHAVDPVRWMYWDAPTKCKSYCGHDRTLVLHLATLRIQDCMLTSAQPKHPSTTCASMLCHPYKNQAT